MKPLAERIGHCIGSFATAGTFGLFGLTLASGSAWAQTPAVAPPPAMQADTSDTSPSVSQVPPAATPQRPLSANEAAGLPDLDAINRPGATSHATVDLNGVREPSYHSVDRYGTEITEYRDRGKSTEIDVRSNFGTRYQMSTPTDTSPRVPMNVSPTGRVPSIKLSY